MFYAVTDLLTIATIWTWVIAIQPIYANPTQPNPWVDPTHVHVCAQYFLSGVRPTVRHAAADVGGGSISSALDSQHAIGLAIVACYF